MIAAGFFLKQQKFSVTSQSSFEVCVLVQTLEVGKLRASLEALEKLEAEHREEHKNAVEASAAAAVENLKAQIVELQGRLQVQLFGAPLDKASSSGRVGSVW